MRRIKGNRRRTAGTASIVLVVLACSCENADLGAPSSSPGVGTAALAEPSSALPPAVGSAPAVPDDSAEFPNHVPPRGVLIQAAPGQMVVEMAPDERASCRACACPQADCGCRPLRSGGCLCVPADDGPDCACTCDGVPSVVREANTGAVGWPMPGAAGEVP